jgi:hypothetical protein
VSIDKILEVFDRHNADPEVDNHKTVIQWTCRDCGIRPYRLCEALSYRINKLQEAARAGTTPTDGAYPHTLRPAHRKLQSMSVRLTEDDLKPCGICKADHQRESAAQLVPACEDDKNLGYKFSGYWIVRCTWCDTGTLPYPFMTEAVLVWNNIYSTEPTKEEF